MCHYCHVLQNNPTAPMHPGVRCLDRSNHYSQVPMANRTYDHGQLIFPVPSAPPAEEEFTSKTSSKNKNLCRRFMEIFCK